MKGITSWSYAPFKPTLWDSGDITVTRIVPEKDSIHIEWLGCEAKALYISKRDENDYAKYSAEGKNELDVCGLDKDTDYEFYLEGDGKKSRVRLARCGDGVGIAVNYLHPDDAVYSFSGRYLCSPSLLVHPDGYMLASMDLYASSHPQNLTIIFRSDDGGESWHYQCELMPCFWGKLFYHNGAVYMLSVSTEYGDLLISRSDDGGKSFESPVTLLCGTNGKNGGIGVHKNPQNMLIHKGRLYGTLEYGAWANKDFCHAAMVMSCDVNADLLDPLSWSFTEPRKFDNFADEIADMPKCTMTIEGTLVLDPEGELLNVMRFGKRGNALAYKVNTDSHEAMLEYHSLIDFNANLSKFMIKRDPVSNKYYSVATTLYDGCPDNARDYLTLMESDDLKSFRTVRELIDHRGTDTKHIGFQYVDFEFDGDDIIFLCRTAFNGAHNYHDSNYITFHRIKDFRNNA